MVVRLLAASLAMIAVVGLGSPVGPPVSPVGPAYRQRAFDLQVLAWGDLMYNGSHISPPAPNGAVDEDGVPMRQWGARLYYTADNIARQGLYRLNGFVHTGDEAYTQVLERFDAKLHELAMPVDDAWFFPWPFTYGDERLVRPWYNAMTQGLVLSFFARMYEVYGGDDDLEAAGHVFTSFETMGPVAAPWVATVERGYLWLEHYPGGVTRHVLNAHLWATFGLYDYWQLVRDEDAADTVATMLDGAATTVRDNVWRYRRVGRTSLYALVHRTSYMHYHLLHIRQLRLLAEITADSSFARMADLLYAAAH